MTNEVLAFLEGLLISSLFYVVFLKKSSGAALLTNSLCLILCLKLAIRVQQQLKTVSTVTLAWVTSCFCLYLLKLTI